MPFASRTVWADITNKRVTAALIVRGAEKQTHREPLPDEWGERELADAIQTCLEALGAPTARVEIFWRADGAVTSVVQTPVVGPTAHDAALLSEIETGSINPARSAVECETLATSGDGSLVLIASIDLDQRAMVQRAVRSAGGKPGRVFAGESFAASAAIAHAEAASQDDPSIALVLGDDASAIAVASEQNAKLVRFADVGLASLGDAYRTRLEAAQDPPDDPGAEARRLLTEEYGVPGLEDEIAPSVRGSDVLRAMQPVLQRLAVELKQSLRYTLTADERSRVCLRIAGPAESVQGLNEVLAEQLEIDAAPYAHPDRQSSWFSLIKRVGLTGRTGVQESARASDKETMLSRALWTGVAASFVLLVVLGFAADRSAETSKQRIRAAGLTLDEAQSNIITDEQRRVSSAVKALERTLREGVASTADNAAALRLVATAAGERIEVDSISLTRTSTSTLVELRASASGDTASDARAAIQTFAAALDTSAVTSSVKVGSIRSVTEPERLYATFDATITLQESVRDWIEEGEAS